MIMSPIFFCVLLRKSTTWVSIQKRGHAGIAGVLRLALLLQVRLLMFRRLGNRLIGKPAYVQQLE